MTKNVAIVHYNTPELTAAAIKSLLLHTPDCKITVFENSDKRPLPPIDNVTVLDNTKGQLVDFEEMLSRYPDKIPTACNWGSEKHIASVDYLFDVLQEGFLLVDSDVLFKKDITSLFDSSKAWVGAIEHKPKFWFQAVRCFPMLLWINVPMLREHNIRFFHEGMVYKMSHTKPPYYDTGGSLYVDCNKAGLPYTEINMFDYIEHLGGASCYQTNWKKWLDLHKDLYEPMGEEKKTQKATGEQILVVIPYCSKGAQGRELEYAVAGWRRHFKENYLIVLAGEDHPITKTGDDIICIESPRVDDIPGMYRQHLDYVSCFKKVHKAFPDSKGFIFVADDVYAVNDFDMSDVLCLKQKGPNMDDFRSTTTNRWQKDKIRTRELLKREGYPTRNFTTHLPQYFEWDKIEALWEKYDMEHNSYTIEDLYYNIYYPTRIPLQIHIDFDNFKCGVYRPNPRLEYIDKAFTTKIWIQNSVEGWIPYLDRALANYYGI